MSFRDFAVNTFFSMAYLLQFRNLGFNLSFNYDAMKYIQQTKFFIISGIDLLLLNSLKI